MASFSDPRSPRAALLLALVAAVGGAPWTAHATHIFVRDPAQRNADLTPICSGCASKNGSRIEISASTNGGGGSTSSLEFEVRPIGTPFSNQVTHVSPSLPNLPGNALFPWTPLPNLQEGASYQWQARVLAYDHPSAWVAGHIFTVGAPPTQRLVFTSLPQTLVAGACSDVATVASRDAGGNPLPVTNDTAVVLRSQSPTAAFFSDASCQTPSTFRTMSAGSDNVSFYFRDTTSGSPLIFADAPGRRWAEQVATVTPGAAAKLSFTTSWSSLTGTCSHVVSAQILDSHGNTVIAKTATAVTLRSTSPTTVFYQPNQSCVAGTELTGATIPQGASSFGFRWREPTPGSFTIEIGASGITSASQSFTANGFLVISTAPQTLVAGQCAAITTMQSEDGNRAAWKVPADAIVNLWATSGVTFFADSGCKTPVKSVTMAAGASTASFYWTSTRAGSAYMWGSSERHLNFSQNHTILPAPSAGIGFATSPATVVAGDCRSATVNGLDPYGNSSPLGSETTVSLSASSPTLAFFADTACKSTTSTLVIKPGGSGTPFYWKELTPGSPKLTVSGTSLAPATQTQTVQPRLAFSTPPQSLVAGACSAKTTVQVQDGSGAAWGGSGNTGLTVSGTAGVQLYSDAGCQTPLASPTIPSAGDSASFYWRSLKVASPSLTVSAAGHGSASQAQTIVAGPPAAVTFVSQPLSAVAGMCSGANVVELQDTFGNPTTAAAPLTLDVVSSSTTMSFFAKADCTVALAPVPPGSGRATFYWMDTIAGSPSVTVGGNALAAAKQSHAVIGGPSTGLYLQPPPPLTAGKCSSAMVVRATDAFGNPVGAPAGATATVTARSQTMRFFSDAACLVALGAAPLSGTPASATFHALDKAAGVSTISITAAALRPVSAPVTVEPAPPASLSFTTFAVPLSAGLCSNAVEVRTEDAFANPSPVDAAMAIELRASSTTLVFFDKPGCTAPAVTSVTLPKGASTLGFHFREVTAGAPKILVSSGSLPKVTQQQTVNPAPPAQFDIRTLAQSLRAGDCSKRVDVALMDVLRNRAFSPGLVATLSSSSSAATFYAEGDPTCAGTPISGVTFGAGQSEVRFFFKDKKAGSPVIQVSQASVLAAQQTQSIRPGPATELSLAGFPSPTIAGVPGTFTLSATDRFGNDATDYSGTVTFASTDPRASLSPPFTFSSGPPARRVFAATLASAGTRSLSVRDAAPAPLSATQAGIEVRPAPASSLRLVGVSKTVSGTPMTVTVRATDRAGNVDPSYRGTVGFSSSDPVAKLPSEYEFKGVDNGEHVFSEPLVLNTAGEWDVTVADKYDRLEGATERVQVLQKSGGVCARDSECGKGLCVKGICCDKACSGACEACDLAGKVGACTPRPDGTPCPNALYCDGAETCRRGTCEKATPIACEPEDDRRVEVCDEAARACKLVKDAPPAILREALSSAGLHLAYPFSAFGRVRARGARPMTFGVCGGPPGFRVEKETGVVDWTPAGAGAVALCVSAQNGLGNDSYTFVVRVDEQALGPPLPSFEWTPVGGKAPLAVSFDGRASRGADQAPVSVHRWDFGHMGPLAGGAAVKTTYLLPGGYNPELTVFDGMGRGASLKRSLSVLDDRGLRPPQAKIVASATSGVGELPVVFSCDCAEGDSPIVAHSWSFGGEGAAGASVTRTFGPGRVRVRLTVVDRNGLASTDSVEIAVANADGAQPPHCRAHVEPQAGTVPFTVAYGAAFSSGDAPIASHTLTLPGGPPSGELELSATLLEPGNSQALLKVTDDQGLSCIDAVSAVALSPRGGLPPRIVSIPGAGAECGTEYTYAPTASGTGPLRWSLVSTADSPSPSGATIDTATGEVRWTPSARLEGRQTLSLEVVGPGGRDQQAIPVDVRCGERASVSVGCGCRAGGGLEGLAALLATLGYGAARRVRARRRSRRWPGFTPCA